MKIELLNENYYHIYNHAVGNENLFRTKDNFEYFLRLYNVFISPVADTFAWCLLPNHFHFLVRIKEDKNIGYLNSLERDSKDIFVKWKTYFHGKNFDGEELLLNKKPIPEKQFFHLCDAYAKAYNKAFKRKGRLFEEFLKVLPVDNQKYYRNLVFYIHNNPVHHGFVEEIGQYGWTSYRSIISERPTKVNKEEVLGWFSDVNEYKVYHTELHDDELISKYIADAE